MKITSATFMRGLKGDNEILHDGTPQIAFIGRSNVGKSSMMNTLTNQRKLARTSNTPGRTQEINKVDKIKKSHYLTHITKLAEQLKGYMLVPFSSKTRVGVEELTEALLS